MKDFAFNGNDGQKLYASSLGSGIPVVILHGGGPDRQSLIPFAELLQNDCKVIFPDIRGYGQSVCTDTSKHNWKQYAADVIALLEHLRIDQAVVCGMGLGASITERVAFTYPDRIIGVVLISPETLDKDGEGSSPQEKEMFDDCAATAKNQGLEKAWEPFLPQLAPVINLMVKDAMPRTSPESFSAAMAIVHSKRLESHQQLTEITAPTLVIPGNDARHDAGLGHEYLELIPNCQIGKAVDWAAIFTTVELAQMVIPQVLRFIRGLAQR
jgi:pimeloyl-ACP methyl ester carboxylesterase